MVRAGGVQPEIRLAAGWLSASNLLVAVQLHGAACSPALGARQAHQKPAPARRGYTQMNFAQPNHERAGSPPPFLLASETSGRWADISRRPIGHRNS